jgi:N-acyl-D-aspartate/D-glutamate deacylase
MKLALTLLVCALGPLEAQRHIIRAGMVLDGRGNVALNQTIVIDNDSITSIGTSLGQADRKPDLDLSEETVMPGWIGACLPVTDSDSIMEAETKAFRLLTNGFTTVVAPSTRLRDLIEDQRWAGPRMLPHGNCDSANHFLAAVRQGSPISQEELAGVTSRAAQEFGISDRTGVLAPGMLADLVVTHGNPLTDGAALRSIVYVLKEGHIYREPNTPKRLKLILRP